jgi:hypothetical protein
MAAPQLNWSSVRCEVCGVEGGQPCNPVAHVKALRGELLSALDRMLADRARCWALEDLVRQLYARVPPEVVLDEATRAVVASVPRMPGRGS